jgi:hypothetical protein
LFVFVPPSIVQPSVNSEPFVFTTLTCSVVGVVL